MNVIFLIARILFVFMFIASAIGHLTKADAMAGYAKFKGAPGGKFGVVLSGLTMGVGALMVLLGVWGDIGALLILATLLPITFYMHAYWKEADDAKQADQVMFNKNVALMGGALALFLLFAAATAGFTITGPAIHLG